MLNPKELLSSSLKEVEEREKELSSINISYNRIKMILSLLEPQHYGSLRKMTDYLYDKGIFTYKRKTVRRIKKETIKHYLLSCSELKIITYDGKLTNLGNALVNSLENENKLKKILGSSLKERDDVKIILSALYDLSIPNSDNIREKIEENIEIHQASLSNLINLLASCDLIHKNRKATYYALNLASKILKKLKNTKEALSIDKIDHYFREQGFSAVEIQEELVQLLINNKIKLSEQLSEDCLELLKHTIEFKKSFVVPVTVKLISDYYYFLEMKAIQDPENYIKNLTKTHYQYLEIGPYSAKVNLLTFKQIAPYDAIVNTK